MNKSNPLPNLDKLLNDEDEQDFVPLGGSNLAAIFGAPAKPLDANVSTKRSSQKKVSESGRSTPQSVVSNKSDDSDVKVIIAKVVHAYKLQNGQYTLIGKLGLALTGNPSVPSYSLILYKGKQEHISVVPLKPDFFYSVQENNYATYYDISNDNWSILFENVEASVEFAREIGLSKNFLRGSSNENVFYQDLNVASCKDGAKEDDKIVLKYSITPSITQPLKIPPSAVQNMEIQISSDDNWERSLLGVSKGLKRLLILPPGKQISLGPGFPRDKDVCLDIEVVDIIPPEIGSSTSPKPGAKASLISRMAKMGQSILPKLPNSTTTDSEDTEDEINIKSPRRLRSQSESFQKNSPKNIDNTTPESSNQSNNTLIQRNAIPNMSNSRASAVSTSGFPSTWIPSPIQNQYVCNADTQLYPIQSNLSQSVSAALDPNVNIFLSETRTHNAEIRMGMSKISDNVQKLLDKFHTLEINNSTSPVNDKMLETSLRMLIALNTKNDLKETSDCDKSIKNGLNSKTDTDERIKSLESNLESTKNTLDETLSRLDKLQTEKRDFEREEYELRERIQKLESSVENSRSELHKSLIEIKNTNDLAIKYQKENARLEARIITLTAEQKILKKLLGSKSLKSLKNDQHRAAEIKQIMNKMYQSLMGRFTDEESYTAEHIKFTIANTIRTITLQILKEGKTDDASSDTEMKDNEDIINFQDSDLKMDLTGSTQDELPPIPPMDLDMDNVWLP